MRRLLVIGLVALAGSVVALALAGPNSQRRRDQGRVHFLRIASSEFDSFTRRRSPKYGAFLRRHMWRMVAYSPYFDNKTRWYPNAWVYDDAYAIGRGSGLAARHPDWILRDRAGNPLFIPYGCANGTCPQYAADISNAAFRRAWIAEARAKLSHGYRGLFIDDVNMELRVADGREHQVAPIDRSTGLPMTYDAWRDYMARFMEEIRAALRHTEIAQNAIWFAAPLARTADPYVRRQIKSADYVALERGVNDAGLTGGGGDFSVKAFLAYIDAVHSLHRGISLEGEVSGRPAAEYELAAYLLISEGHDLISIPDMTPLHWWTGLDVDLGHAAGARHRWHGLLRRDFNRGMALLNEPGAPAQTVRLPRAMRNLDGKPVTTLTIPAASGAVLRRA
jgi:putative glycosyl hydrolase-like family 15 (GHL15) protein